MLGRDYRNQNCSAARALEIAGERWSLLILRDALFRGMTHFSDFQLSLGIATNVLASRLDGFIADGVMVRQADRYVLTPKGEDFAPVIVALTQWGDRWSAPSGPPVTFEHSDCGAPVRQSLHCTKCGEETPVAHVHARPSRVRSTGRRSRRSR